MPQNQLARKEIAREIKECDIGKSRCARKWSHAPDAVGAEALAGTKSRSPSNRCSFHIDRSCEKAVRGGLLSD